MIRQWIALTILAVGVAVISDAGTLQITSPSVNNQLVTIPVHVDGDVADGVAALDFLLNYDPSVLEVVGVTPGTAATAAGKMVHGAPTNPGQYVVVMMGMNQSAVKVGEVVNVALRQVGNPDNNQSELSITRTTFASLDAVEIPSEGSAATLVLDAGDDGDEEPNDENPDETPADDGDDTVEPDEDQPMVPTGQPKTSEDPETPRTDSRGGLLPGSPLPGLGLPAAENGERQPKPLDLRQLAALVKAAENRRAALPTSARGPTDRGAAYADPSSPSEGRTTEGPIPAKPAGDTSASKPGIDATTPLAATAPVTGSPLSESGPKAPGHGSGNATPEDPNSTAWAIAGVLLMATLAVGLMVIRRSVFR
ncbi:MAG: hypothetical protein GY851_15385 [bacterium]|nr:hypothetical protein [bacterium]